MKSIKLEYEDQSSALVWAEGVGGRAGIFLLDGRCHVATERSPAERRLRESGAIHVATLTFDGSHADRRGGAASEDLRLDPIAPREAAAKLGWVNARN